MLSKPILKPYEGHITFRLKEREALKSLAKSRGFSYSCLTGDEEFGPDKLVYCTLRTETLAEMQKRMEEFKIESSCIDFCLRYKIEFTLEDRFYESNGREKQ
jgi:hypothetical protein